MTSGLAATLQHVDDPDKLETIHRVSKYIMGMDEEVRDRFKALGVLKEECDKFDLEMQHEVRQLDILYHELYKEIDEQRAQLIAGELDI